eukprot:497907_1
MKLLYSLLCITHLLSLYIFANDANCHCFDLYLFNMRLQPGSDAIYCYQYNIIRKEQFTHFSDCNNNLNYIGLELCPNDYQYINSLTNPIDTIIHKITLLQDGQYDKLIEQHIIKNGNQIVGININIEYNNGIEICLHNI